VATMREAERRQNLTDAASALRGRLEKRQRHLARWAAREGTDAYRLFDRDIPGWHFAVDRYGDYAVIAEYPWKAGEPRHLERREALLHALGEVCGLPRSHLVLKEHLRAKPDRVRYERREGDLRIVVKEGPLRFEVNLAPYLDVGLFLDQRTVRRWVRERCKGRSVANLFCYTGSFTVAAAVGQASRTLSIDLSKSYLAWAKRNLELNGVAAGPRHELREADVLAQVEVEPKERFDLVICDPPPQSVSKRARRFDVQRDHERLLLALETWLAPGGALYFACNLGGFQLSDGVKAKLGGVELTPGSLPEDFRGRPSHRAWLFGARWLATG
jgi:23S rRNA G2069 N7-methylase RlmK/C1962 C5-methylase RlmI